MKEIHLALKLRRTEPTLKNRSQDRDQNQLNPFQKVSVVTHKFLTQTVITILEAEKDLTTKY